MERLCIHLVPVRVSIGARDYLDKVSLSTSEFFREVRDSPIPPRTSQPPAGDFRRLFEFLLSHHESVVYAGIARRLSGTLQTGEGAAERSAPGRVHVVDSLNGSCAQGLIALDAAEAVAAGFDAARVVRRIEQMRARTRLLGAIRDISYGVRGGRAPKLAAPLCRLTGLKPIIRSRRNGKIGLAGFIRAGADLPERFAERIAARLKPGSRYRALVAHCDCAAQGERLRARLLALAPQIERHWLIEAGAAIGAHAGPGSLVVGLQETLPLDATP
jgi:DegV family protein with EDD domain